jgi:hypothetical protein
MLRKTMIVLATAAALTGGLTVDAFAHGGGGGGGGHGGGFGGGGGHGAGFGGGGGHGAGFGGGHFGGGHFGGAEIGRGFGRVAGPHFAGRHGKFGLERGFDHRRFGRGFGVVPEWGYGLYDYGCSYSYPNNYGYSCDMPPAY